MEERQQVIENIIAMVKASSKTQEQISLEMGLNKSAVSEYVCGRCLPPLLIFKKLCQVLDCSYEDILGRQ